MFDKFAKAVIARFDVMKRNELFVVDLDDLYAKYLAAFPAGTDPLYRKETEHTCHTCRNFIKNLGGVIAFDDNGERMTVWGGLGALPEPYETVAERMSDLVLQAPIKSVYRTKQNWYGERHNYDAHTNRQWSHFYGVIAQRHYSKDADKARGDFNTKAQVFERGLRELTIEAFDTALDLINNNELYRGAEYENAVRKFRDFKLAYDASADKEAFAWSQSDTPVARIRNNAFGTLLINLSKGLDLDACLRAYDAVMAPRNFRRSSAPITTKMVQQANATLESLGLEQSIKRRFATVEDLSVNDVLFVDNAVQGKMRGGIEDLLALDVKPAKAPDLAHAQKIDPDQFINTILPQASSLKLKLTNKHLGNFVSITAPQHESTGRLFNWQNDFSWSYDGDVKDSVKERVKAAGGRTDTFFRVSLSWFNFDDLDLHCYAPSGEHIYFRNKMGILDVDMNAGGGHKRDAVENMAFNSLQDGVYGFSVHNFTRRESVDVGFNIDVEFEGVVTTYTYNNAVPNGGRVNAVVVTVKDGRPVKFESNLPSVSASATKWGLSTDTLVDVETVLLSPNHWDGAGGFGSKHLFFMLKGCKNPDPVRGFYNEDLRPELQEHRKVFEVLGARTKCEVSETQLSGVGFTRARGDTVTVIVDNNRAYELMF